MNYKTLQYYLITSICFLALIWNSYILMSWYLGDGFMLFGYKLGMQASPSMLINSLIILAYSICFVGFNWPSSKRLSNIRLFGMIYSLLMLIVSLLMVNDVIAFKDSWNYVIGGMTISLALSGIFQIYRTVNFDNSLQRLLKFVLMVFTIIVFSSLCAIYLIVPGSTEFYNTFEIVLIVYSVLVVMFFVWKMFTTKADRSMRKK